MDTNIGNRSLITSSLKDAAESYFLKKRYSCFQEIGVLKWGKLRADVLAVNLKGHIIITEIKSCPEDYKVDTKWTSYLDYCDNFYFVVTRKTFSFLEKKLRFDHKEYGVGTLVLGEDGYLHNSIKSYYYPVDDDTRWNLVLRMAWRNGSSIRTRRRKRHYVS